MLIRLARRSMILPTDRLWKATKQAQSFPEIRGKNIPGSILTGMYLSFRSSGTYEMFIGQAWQASLSNSFPAKAASLFWRAESSVCLHNLLHVLHLWDLRARDSRFRTKITKLKGFQNRKCGYLWQRKLVSWTLTKTCSKWQWTSRCFELKSTNKASSCPVSPTPSPKYSIVTITFHHSTKKSSNHPFPQMSGLYNPVHCMHFHFWNVSYDLLNLNLWYLLTGEREQVEAKQVL